MFKQFKIHRIPMDLQSSKLEVNPKKILDMQRKIQAHLASDIELKASAQRAFLVSQFLTLVHFFIFGQICYLSLGIPEVDLFTEKQGNFQR